MNIIKKYKIYFSFIIMILFTLIIVKYLIIRSYYLYTDVKSKSDNYININEKYKSMQILSDTLSNRFVLSTGMYNTLLVERLAKLCEKYSCKLIEVSPDDENLISDIPLHTVYFNIKGSFHNLSRILYNIEKGSIYGNASSIKFYIKQDVFTKRKELILSLTMQFILKQEL